MCHVYMYDPGESESLLATCRSLVPLTPLKQCLSYTLKKDGLKVAL